jgi:hypothetical protein
VQEGGGGREMGRRLSLQLSLHSSSIISTQSISSLVSYKNATHDMPLVRSVQ